MSNWDNVPDCWIDFEADCIVDVSKGTYKNISVTISGAWVKPVVESIGTAEILRGIGVEAVREWLEEQEVEIEHERLNNGG